MRLLCVVLLVLVSVSFSQQGNPDSRTKYAGIEKRNTQNKADDKSNTPPQHSESTIEECNGYFSIHEPQSANQQGEAYDARHDTLYRAYLWFTIIGVIGALVGLFLIWTQVGIAKEAADAAKNSAEIALNSQRSWILADGVTKTDINTQWIVKATCRFAVYGKSPVRVTEAYIIFKKVGARELPGSRKEPDLPPVPEYGEPITLEELPMMGAVCPPGGEFFIVPKLEGFFLSPEEDKTINDRESFLVIYGLIKYRDAFAKAALRETRFCYEYGIRDFLEQKRENLAFIVGGPPIYTEIT